MFVEDYVLSDELKQRSVIPKRRSDLQKHQLQLCLDVLVSNAPDGRGREWLDEQKSEWLSIFLPIYCESIEVGKLDESGDFQGFSKLQWLMQVAPWKSSTSLGCNHYELFCLQDSMAPCQQPFPMPSFHYDQGGSSGNRVVVININGVPIQFANV